MAAEATFDLDGAIPGQRAAAVAPATSAITRERAPAPLGWPFVGITLALAAAAGAVAWGIGATAAETPLEHAAAPWVLGLADGALAAGRTVSALATAALVAAVAAAGRALTRSDVAGLLAGALAALDPAVLVHGTLATPTAVAVAGFAVALAGFLSHRPWLTWAAGAALAVGAFADPRLLLAAPVFVALAVLRGNIYASPRHLGIAAAQAILLPSVGALLHWAANGSLSTGPACLTPALADAALLRVAVQPGPETLAQPNPVTWFAGGGAMLFLGLGAAAFAVSRFRLARANGRLQVRLVAPFPAVLGRGAWLLLLLLATLPVPQAWTALFALAVALGVQDLGEDAPGFGIALAGSVLLFAGLVLLRAWGAVAGTGGADGVLDALGLVPWAEATQC